jgi:hypothetical protein
LILHNSNQQALVYWASKSDWDVAATFTFPAYVTESQARKIFKHFWNKIDKRIYGNAARKHNKRVQRLSFIEGIENGNVHYHVIAKTPDRFDYKMFRQILLLQFEELSGAGSHNEVKRTTDENGWLGYISKGIKTFSADALDVFTSHIAG